MKNQILIVGITLVLLVVGLSGCTEEDTSSDLGYQNTEYGFALNPPEGWTVEDISNEFGVFVYFLGPTENNFQINMFITANTSDSEDSLNTVVEQYQVLLSDPNITVDISRETTVNGMNAYEFVYSANMLKQNVVLVEKNKLILILVYSALENSYDTYLPVFEESVDSLVIE